MEKKSLLECIEVNPSHEPLVTVIWMHGLGADGNDFSNIVPSLNLPKNIPVRFLFPHAPIRPITINGGFPMRAWFDVYGLSSNSKLDEVGMKASELLVVSLIEHEKSLGIFPERIFLAGFSQGGAMSLFTGLRYQEKIAGIISLSGFFPFNQSTVRSLSVKNKDTHIFLAHGVFDQIIDKSFADLSKKGLVDLGYSVESHFYSMAHEVCSEEIEDLSKWIKKIINYISPGGV